MYKIILKAALTLALLAGLPLMLCITAVAAVGYTFTENDITFKELTESGTTGTVQVGTGKFNDTAISHETQGTLVIPSIVSYEGKRYTVTSIGNYAFSYCGGVQSVTIPDSVTRIEDNAFIYCGVTSLTIPDNVTYIGENAFYMCGLKSVTIPNSVKNIDAGAFSYCSDLLSVTIPKSITTISTVAFAHCRSLTSVTIPNGVTSIGEGAFGACSSLTSVTIPDSVTSIGDGAFSSCGLTSISIPNSVKSIGKNAFSDSKLTNVSIPDSVTSIGEYTFSYCGSLTSVTIPKSVTSIGSFAFQRCITLTDFNVSPDNPAYSAIGEVLFNKDKTELVSYPSARGTYTIPGIVKSIGSSAFAGFYLESVIIPGSVTRIGDNAFYGCENLINVTIPDSVKHIGNNAFSFCGRLTGVIIPNGVTSISDSMFYHCNSLESVTIPNSVTSIGESAFRNCQSLKSIIIPNSVRSIGDNAFTECGLTSVTIPDGVTSIGVAAFMGCDDLKSVIISKSVISIDDSAFRGCGDLSDMQVSPDNPVYSAIGGTLFLKNVTDPTMAEKEKAADALYRLKLFVGTGTDSSGKPIYELQKRLTRLEALALAIRLLGLENDSKAFTGASNFTDVPAWGDRYASFGYHLGITVGVNAEHTLFAPDRQATFLEFSAFLLRALGYTEANGDYMYSGAAMKADEIGMFSPFEYSKIYVENFLRGNAVLQVADALLTKSKGSNKLLLYELADKSIFSKNDADWFVSNVK